ncbi:MAG TPA: hypothetical protein VEX18_01815, partial [Polyangiaceae bacterium]|nr:hypothetical protein [Polyangiaceae bacterium]
MTAAWAPLAGCGGRAGSNGRGSGAQGGETSLGGGGAQGGQAPDEPPPLPVDPEVSRAWTWEPCGTLQPAAGDREALFDADGRIVVLGASGVRVYDAAGARADLASAVQADFLVTASDGSVLSGRSTDAGVALTPLGASDPSIVLPSAPAGVCGSRFAMSADGAYVLATGEDLGCAWRVSDSSFVGSVAAEQMTVRNSHFVTVEFGVMSRDVVQRDFAGRELSRRQLGDGPIILSPAGDRAVTMIDRALVDLDSGDVVPWDVPPATARPLPVFSPRGEMVLVGDGIFSTADGVRRFSLDPQGRLAGSGGRELTLASDGSRAVSSGFGRATLFDVEAKGVRAVLGPPVLPDPLRDSRGASDLAVSRDGTLLVYNMELSGAFGIQPAPSF